MIMIMIMIIIIIIIINKRAVLETLESYNLKDENKQSINIYNFKLYIQKYYLHSFKN